jgi:hypothetical protein
VLQSSAPCASEGTLLDQMCKMLHMYDGLLHLKKFLRPELLDFQVVILYPDGCTRLNNCILGSPATVYIQIPGSSTTSVAD